MTASAVAIPIAFVPVFEAAAPFGWFIGAALGALAYWLMTDRTQRFDDVGTAIAVGQAR